MGESCLGSWCWTSGPIRESESVGGGGGSAIPRPEVTLIYQKSSVDDMTWKTPRATVDEIKGRGRLDTREVQLSVLCSGGHGNEKLFFFSTTIILARSHPAELFQIVHSLIHSGTTEKGKASVA